MSKLDMFNKEYSLELLGNKIRYNKEYVAHDIYRLYIKKNEIELLEKYLTELQAIKNSNPSDAMEEIKMLRGFNEVELNNDKNINKSLDVIEQALLKAQELGEENAEYKKVLEIIKESPFESAVTINYIKVNKNYPKMLDYENYCMSLDVIFRVFKEEFVTLKEWLK